MVIKVIYKSKNIISELDDKIRATLERAGMKWYAQGYNLTNHERDICFDVASD